MSYSDTVTKALLLKHAEAMGKDPFTPAYGQESMQPVSAPPGSLEAKKQEEMESATAEAEAQQKQQAAEMKEKEKAVGNAQKERDKLMQNQQKLQQDLMAARAEVDAFKARDSASSPGLSPSFNATQKRMQERVKSLGRASRQYNGALTLSKAAEVAVKMAFWKRELEKPRWERVADLVKIADSMNPGATNPPQPKTVRGPGALVEPRQGAANAVKTPTPTGGGAAVPAPVTAAPANIKPLSAFKGDEYSTPANQWRQQFGKGALPEQYQQQYKDMLAQDSAAVQADGQKGWLSQMGQAAKDTFGTAQGWSDVGDEYRRFGENPNQYMTDSGSWLADNGLRDMVDRNMEKGTIGNTLFGGLASAGDFAKGFIQHGANNVAGGLAGLTTGGWDAVSGANQALGDMYSTLGSKGLKTKWSDLSSATQAGRDRMTGGFNRMQTGVKNQTLGGLQVGANFIPGGGAVGVARGAAMGAAGYGGEGLIDGFNAASQSPQGELAQAGPSPSPSPSGAPAPQGTPLTVEGMQGIFAGAGNNPGFAQNINDYSGWANPNIFPSAMAGYNMPQNNSFLGQVTNFMTGMLGAPDYNSFQQGQTAFRNAGSPQFANMNNAMTAFGRNQMQPYQMYMHRQNRPAALA